MLAGVVAISTPTVAGHFRSKSRTGMTATSLEVVRITYHSGVCTDIKLKINMLTLPLDSK